MDIYALIIISMFVGYLVGSIPFALIVGKLFYKTDVRKFGSKNLGSANVGRTLGPVAGFLCLFFDVVKGGLPALLMYNIAEKILLDTHPEQLIYLSIVYCVTGFFTSLGHCHPCFANFSGGKAVACICGFLLFSNFKLWVAALIGFLIVFIISRIVSLSSIGSAIVVMIAQFIPFFKEPTIFKYNELFPSLINSELPLFIYNITITLLAILLIYRHISNIRKLIKGEEKKFSFGKVNKVAENEK